MAIPHDWGRMLHARTFALALPLLVAALAGCIADEQVAVTAHAYPEEAPRLDGAALTADLEAFVTAYPDRIGNSTRHLESRDALEGMLDAAGLDVWRHGFTDGGMDQENIIGIKWGTDPSRWVVVGGHYDSYLLGCHRIQACQSGINQGAYDNGAGTMITAHLAQAYADVQTPYTMVFALFDGEERGLQGSRAFVADMRTGEHPYGVVDVVAMLNLDMLGLNWPGTGAPIMVLGSTAMQQRVVAAGQALDIPPEYVSDETLTGGSSDHIPFLDAGIDAGMIWSGFDRIGAPAGAPASTPAGVYPHWHLVDRWETMLSMAGTPEHLAAGFGTAADVASHVLWQVAVAEPQGVSVLTP